MTTMVWKKCVSFIPDFSSRSQYVKSMVCIRIFRLIIAVFYRDKFAAETSRVILLYYMGAALLSQSFFEK